MARKKAQALPRPEPEMWAVRGEIVQETEDAILLDVEGTEHWLPKSQIEYDGERGDVVDVELPDWLAEEKCLADGEGIHTPAPNPEDNGAPQDDPGVPDDDAAPGIDANATVDLMLTIVDISENGEWASATIYALKIHAASMPTSGIRSTPSAAWAGMQIPGSGS